MAGNRILVVEDDVAIRKIIRIALESDPLFTRWKLSAESAVDGLEGLALFREQPPDLMIVDLLMPRMDGFKLVEAVRADAAGKELPIIVTSDVYRDQQTLDRLRDDYQVEVVLKPFNPKQLAHKVIQLLRDPNKLAPAKPGGQVLGRIKPNRTRHEKGGRGQDQVAPPEGSRAPSRKEGSGFRADQQAAAPLKPRRRPADTPKSVSRPKFREPTPGSPSPTVRAHGDLTETPMAQVLLGGLEERYTGQIDVAHGKVRKRIYMMMGYTVFVESNLRSETLGQLLVKKGILTQEQLRLALATMKEQDVKFGEALSRLKLVNGLQVLEHLTDQIRHKLEVCLPWHEGSWVYTEDLSLASRTPHHTIDPVDLVLEALPRQVNLEDFLSRLSVNAESFRLELLPRGARLQHRFAIHHGQDLLDAVIDGKSVAELLQTMDLRRAVGQVFTLVECGMARQVRLRRPSVAREISTDDMLALGNLADQVLNTIPFSMEEADLNLDASEKLSVTPLGARAVAPDDTEEIRAVARSEAEEACALISDTYLAMNSSNLYEVLDVACDSPQEVIEVAYNTKISDFALQRFRNLDLGEHFGYLEGIHQRLDLAHRVLASAESRREYDEERFTGQETSEYHSPFLAEQAFDTGEHLASQGRHSEAAEAYSEAQEFDAQPEYRAMEAWAVFKARDASAEAAEEMLEVVAECLEDAPEQYAIHMVAAWLHRAVGDLTLAIHHYQTVIQLNPGLRKAFDELEQLLVETEKLDLLEEQYRRTLFLLDEGDPTYAAELWKRLTMLYAKKLDDRRKAQTALNAAAQLSPDEASELELELFPDDEEEY